jgi:hypothetical protein
MELMGITAIVWIVGVVAAIMLFLMPFFVFKIRNEVVEMNLINRRILALLESVVPEGKKPPTKNCKTCRTVNAIQNVRCSHCGEKFPT